ncbi:MAG: NAD-dependent epimerase/dehydratase family protein [Chitinivibrionales bacterium]|nr:NAD-dependent epimerase/dehydratase family protein [Chitinivibrionales bacterium]
MVVITGGTGVMGRALVQRFTAQGERVRVFSLPNDPGIAATRELGAEVREGDISRADDVAGLCAGARTVYHLAAVIIAYDDAVYERVNVGGTRNIVADAARHGVEHLVHISSASVVYPKTTAYSRSKRAGEEIVTQSGLPYTIIRPTLVYDEYGGEELNAFLAYLSRFPVVPFIGSGRVVKRPVHVEDIIDGLVRLHGNERARGKTFNFSGAERITIREFARLCLRLLGQGNKPIVSLPVWLCHVLAGVMGLVMRRPPLRWQVIAGMTQDADLDPVSAIDEIGYRPSRVSEKLPSCFPRRSR